MKVAGWLAANLFFLACAAMAGGYTWLFIVAMRALRAGELEGYLWAAGAVGIVFATYYSAKWLHRLVAARAR